jgi:hypothetical protein
MEGDQVRALRAPRRRLTLHRPGLSPFRAIFALFTALSGDRE